MLSRRLAISAKELASRIGDKALVKPVPNGVIYDATYEEIWRSS